MSLSENPLAYHPTAFQFESAMVAQILQNLDPKHIKLVRHLPYPHCIPIVSPLYPHCIRIILTLKLVKSTISAQHVSKKLAKNNTNGPLVPFEGRCLKGFRFVQRIQTQQHHETAAVDGKGLEMRRIPEDQLGCCVATRKGRKIRDV